MLSASLFILLRLFPLVSARHMATYSNPVITLAIGHEGVKTSRGVL